MKPHVLDLFAGIGGFSRGLERAGMTVVGQCEIDPFCRAVLAKHWPEVWRFSDVKELTGELVRRNCGRVDLIAGGFPCTDVSLAGAGAGLDGSRSRLWWEMLRVVREVRPRWVIVENVPGLLRRGYDRVCDGLGEAGYDLRAFVVGADNVGAPHRRKRVWIVGESRGDRGRGSEGGTAAGGAGETTGLAALGDGRGTRRGVCGDEGGAGVGGRESAGGGELAHAERGAGGRQGGPRGAEGLQHDGDVGERDENAGGPECGGEFVADPVRPGQRRCGKPESPSVDCPSEELANATGGRRKECGNPQCGGALSSASPYEIAACWPSRPGEAQYEWEPPRLVRFPKQPVGGVIDGIPFRLVRFANRNSLKAYGNALCPQIPELIGRWIMEQDASPERSVT